MPRPKPKLNERIVRRILKERAGGMSVIALAAKYDVTRQSIYMILRGHWYPDVKGPREELDPAKGRPRSLDEDDVEELRRLVSYGVPKKVLMQRYGCTDFLLETALHGRGAYAEFGPFASRLPAAPSWRTPEGEKEMRYRRSMGVPLNKLGRQFKCNRHVVMKIVGYAPKEKACSR